MPVPMAKFDLSGLAPVRELLNLFVVTERVIDKDVVYIPFQFNVFTCLAEEIQYFGIVGALTILVIIGAIASCLENRSLTVMSLGIRGLLYTYLAYSLFADLAFFITGWWLSIFSIAIAVPLVKNIFLKNCQNKMLYEGLY